MVDDALKEVSAAFDVLYSHTGRPSIAPEKLIRALLLEIFYCIRSERLLMERFEHNPLFRWFVGLNTDDPVWVPIIFTRNPHYGDNGTDDDPDNLTIANGGGRGTETDHIC